MLLWLNSDGGYRYKYISQNTAFVGYDRSEKCSECGREIVKLQYSGAEARYEVLGGSTYPDYIQYSGAGEQPFIISEKALKLFAENNVSGYDHAEPVTVEPRGMNKDGSPIDYFQLNICGRAELDFKAMFLKKKKYCAVCGQYEWNRQRFYPRVVDGNSWDGSDLARVVSIPGWILCSDKVRKIVKKHKLKGFVFTEASTSAQL